LNALVTGGCGFIGRWVVKNLLDNGKKVFILDNLSNGSEENVEEFKNHPNFVKLIVGDITDNILLEELFCNEFDICYHLAANINVQDSIDDPELTFTNDVVGTFNILEFCRKSNIKLVFLSSCMVYEKALNLEGIDENHTVKPTSPYSGSKLAAENLVLSYWYTYNMPIVILRPFNTYGPYQKSNSEGGVVSIFINRKIKKEELFIYGDGKQTRDLLYVEDCAEFICSAGLSDKTNGQIINAGYGKDVSMNDLASLISQKTVKINYIDHIHPQSEISKLLCNNKKAFDLLNWKPKTSLEVGIDKTIDWLEKKILQPVRENG